ncbi:uncharacterized protein N7515_010305 [Penicillium bovifimosum]|uniref:Uncharacterized protein n=1 Tax=Penicillium bovifimosum TaxID=126998 RepID=A0A9W9GI79_9EURO|nr:uncharacterized protein N7515_010305 [Penicillium bovifimosum]KAJ5120917.1 hypothetical protein N7515_010305 [Penicillium bovifimosum]
MNYERLAAEVPVAYRVTRETRHRPTAPFPSDTHQPFIPLDPDLLNGLLGWIRNDTFGRVAEICAIWAAILRANKYLAEADRTLQTHKVVHDSFNLGSSLSLESTQTKQLMDAIPGGRRAIPINGADDFALAIKRLRFVRKFE